MSRSSSRQGVGAVSGRCGYLAGRQELYACCGISCDATGDDFEGNSSMSKLARESRRRQSIIYNGGDPPKQ